MGKTSKGFNRRPRTISDGKAERIPFMRAHIWDTIPNHGTTIVAECATPHHPHQSGIMMAFPNAELRCIYTLMMATWAIAALSSMPAGLAVAMCIGASWRLRYSTIHQYLSTL